MMYKKTKAYLYSYLTEQGEKHYTDIRNYRKLIEFLVVAEDHRFFNHPGVDVFAICRAILKNLFLHKREGASTIEQQLVRVLTSDYRRSVTRKLKEMYLALHLKRYSNKEIIAASYLDIAYYGTDYQNLKSILQKYSVGLTENLSDEVCADVVARLKYPEPRIMTDERATQINRRKRYIIERHLKMYGRNDQ